MTRKGRTFVPELIAKSALEGRSLSLGGVNLAEVEAGPIFSIAVFPGGGKTVARGLKSLGLAFPDPNSFVEKAGARIVWTGRDQAFLMGVAPPALDGAAVTDQSDGSAVDVLARMVPMDLRLSACPVGSALRTQVNHMNAVILRTGDHSFEAMVFRSMAQSAWQELETATHMVEARARVKI